MHHIGPMTHTLEPNGTLVGVPELAGLLGVDQSTIHRRISRHELEPSLYLGRRPLWTRDDVERLERGEQLLPPAERAS